MSSTRETTGSLERAALQTFSTAADRAPPRGSPIVLFAKMRGGMADAYSERMQAANTMTRQVITVPPELTLDVAHRVMESHRIRHLVVVQHGKVVGILSDRDVLLSATVDTHGGITVPRSPLGAAMTTEPVTCEPDTTIATLARLMTERKIDAVPVIGSAGRLVGLVTSTDLLLLLIGQDSARPLPFEWDVQEHAIEAQA